MTSSLVPFTLTPSLLRWASQNAPPLSSNLYRLTSRAHHILPTRVGLLFAYPTPNHHLKTTQLKYHFKCQNTKVLNFYASNVYFGDYILYCTVQFLTQNRLSTPTPFQPLSQLETFRVFTRLRVKAMILARSYRPRYQSLP